MTNQSIADIVEMTPQGVAKWRKEKRPIISLIEMYFSKEDLEEFLTYGKVSRLEYCNSMLENEKWFFVTFNDILSALYNLHKADFEMTLAENVRCPNINGIDYICFVLAENKLSGRGSNLFDILIRYYDKYKSEINSKIESSFVEEIYNVLLKDYKSNVDLINLISINNSLYLIENSIAKLTLCDVTKSLSSSSL